ncbi:MAG: type II secretion system F family protein [Desulfobacteraceae bacterium]|nr:type II secretion system F family protein [Desulfobacteraceae bacterium]
MNFFRYKIIEQSGQVASGVVRLPYQETMSAVTHLERNGGFTIYVRKLGKLASFFVKLDTLRRRKRLKRTLQAELLNNLSLMLRSGLPMTTALAESASGKELSQVAGDLKDIIERIQGGASFSEAAEHYGYIFPKTVIHLLKIGEETGKLDEMLKDGADHLTRIQQIVSDTKQALMYPCFVLMAMTGGLIFWFAYVVPKIISLFQEMDVELPRITLILVAVSEFFQVYYMHLLLGGILFAGSLVSAYKSNQRFRKTIDALLLKTPIAGTIIAASALAFITEYFALLINAGIDILQSLSILKKAVSNEVYKEKLEKILQGLARGNGVSEEFRKATIFPSFVVRMLKIGELSGTLSDQLAHIAMEYRKKLSILVSTIGKMIEPAVLVVAGGIFMIIVIGLFLPIYDLISQIGV